MTSEEEKVLEAIRKPCTRIEIARATCLSREEVSKVIRKLERKGLVISRGMTAARRHMALAAAIDVLFREVAILHAMQESRQQIHHGFSSNPAFKRTRQIAARRLALR